MKPSPRELRSCPHCRAKVLLVVSSDRQRRAIAVYADEAPLTGSVACTRDVHSAWRWRRAAPGELLFPGETLHMEHPTPCPTATARALAPASPRRPERTATAALPPGVIDLGAARQKRAQRLQRGR